MKLVMDEKLKHRLIGVAVILSIAIIFTPAVVKKSSQRFDPKVTMTVKLPPRPLHPTVVQKEKEELFKTTRVAHVELESVKEGSQLASLSQADFLEKPALADSYHEADIPAAATDKLHKTKEHVIQKAAQGIQQKNLQKRSTNHSQVKISDKPATIAKKPSKSIAQKKSQVGVRNSEYVIQLASFSVEKNATGLISDLHKRGYSAKITKVPHHDNYLYKVYVGHNKSRDEAEKLKHQLADNFKLNGFIVHRGVS